MNKIIALIFTLTLSSQSFALFSPKLPDKIVCSGSEFCSTSDAKFQIPGWTFIAGETHQFIKPGTYYFNKTFLHGNPNDNFIKNVDFSYVMIDKDGYSYYVDYITDNWVVPMNKDKYEPNPGGANCSSTNASDCYVNIIAPQ